MWSTQSPVELGPWVALEFHAPDDPEFEGEQQTADAAVTDTEIVGWEAAWDAGVAGPSASARQKPFDDDDDSDLGFDDADYDDDDIDDDDLDEDFDEDEDDFDEELEEEGSDDDEL